MTARGLAGAIAAAFVLAACNTEPVDVIATTTFDPSLGVNLASSTKTGSGMYYRDIATGGGAVLAPGHTVGVHYNLFLPSGVKVDSNQAPTAAFSFILGAFQVISGFDEGVTGMHVGGTRQLLIPPAIGYGGTTHGPIPGNSVLIFTVTAVSTN